MWDVAKFDIHVSEKWQAKKYGYPLIYQEAVRRQVELMIEEKIIQPSNSQYINPIVIVPKKDGSIRICLDASAFNSLLIKVHQDPRKIETLLFEETKGEVFSSFDFSQGFLQIPLRTNNFKILSFSSRWYDI